MQSTRQSWPPAAHGADWFRLNRHDDPEPAESPEPKGDPAPADDPEPDPGPEGADKLGDAGKKALDAMKRDRAEAKKAHAAEKKRADDLARKVAEFEDRDKSELERATNKAEAAEKRAEAALSRALKAEVRALASAEFADPEDAAAFLDLSQYATDGDIDTDGLQDALAELLERKPHLRKQAAAEPEPKKTTPKPDPSQGTRKDPAPVDYRTAPREQLQQRLAEFGVRLRR
ncbi:hypothetical protein [Streptomyces pacificus]|uniref:Scaffolding protein n=1 Tax=Streptomyces pacificus TaxID=2705029 RepID=A0A6A0ANT9_9ACTN|nr:hypothetical protein [Streptomyces pacificus]GFH34298.1 hypothetical protein SCWH03_05120 [Streptomyces pacificus]